MVLSLLDILEIFPPLPENYAVSHSQLSPHMQKVVNGLNIKNENEKLIADFAPKKNYLISAYMLKSYLRAGVKITGILKETLYCIVFKNSFKVVIVFV